jgi:hypothetical protein
MLSELTNIENKAVPKTLPRSHIYEDEYLAKSGSLMSVLDLEQSLKQYLSPNSAGQLHSVYSHKYQILSSIQNKTALAPTTNRSLLVWFTLR